MPRPLWRRLAAILGAVVLLVSSAPIAPASAHGDAGWGWVKNYGSGYKYHIPVCPPFGMANWDDYQNSKKQAATDAAMHEWDIASGLYFYRSNTSCETLKNNTTPFVRIVWDTDTCWIPLWFQAFPAGACNISNPMKTYTNLADEYNSEAQDYSSDGSGVCAGSNGRCIVWIEIRVNAPVDDHPFYWGDSKLTNYNNGFTTVRGELAHELGHAAGSSHLARSDSSGIDAMCDDFNYPDSSNSLMCEVIEPREWNISPKYHDTQIIYNKYGAQTS